MLILDLCGGTGSWSKPYLEAGYRVELIDILNGRDVRLVQRMRGVHGILAAPVCTVQSYARNRYPPTEAELLASLSVVDACLRVVFAHRDYLKWWALENPRNKLRRYLGPARLEFYQMGIRGCGTQTDVHLGRLRAAREAAEAADEAEHVPHEPGKRSAGRCDHTPWLCKGVLRGESLMADASPGGVEGVQALIEKWRAEAERHAKHGDCYRRGQAWGLDDCANELEALLVLRPQLVEQKDDLESRVDQSALSEPTGSTAREQPDSSQQ